VTSASQAAHWSCKCDEAKAGAEIGAENNAAVVAMKWRRVNISLAFFWMLQRGAVEYTCTVQYAVEKSAPRVQSSLCDRTPVVKVELFRSLHGQGNHAMCPFDLTMP
jgi:hypothetical protein